VIMNSIADELGTITARAGRARGAEAEAVAEELFGTSFPATGPNYWR
jgi:hypothetical protein